MGRLPSSDSIGGKWFTRHAVPWENEVGFLIGDPTLIHGSRPRGRFSAGIEAGSSLWEFLHKAYHGFGSVIKGWRRTDGERAICVQSFFCPPERTCCLSFRPTPLGFPEHRKKREIFQRVEVTALDPAKKDDVPKPWVRLSLVLYAGRGFRAEPKSLQKNCGPIAPAGFGFG